MLAAILLAQRINAASGGVVIAPWQIDELPNTWLDAFTAFTDDLPAMKRSRQEVEKVKADLRKRISGKK